MRLAGCPACNGRGLCVFPSDGRTSPPTVFPCPLHVNYAIPPMYFSRNAGIRFPYADVEGQPGFPVREKTGG